MRCILSSQNAATIWSAAGDAQNATVDRASAEAEMSEMRDLLGRSAQPEKLVPPENRPQLYRRLTLVFVSRCTATVRFEI